MLHYFTDRNNVNKTDADPEDFCKCDDSYAFTLTVTTDSYRLDRGEKMLLQFLFLRGKN